MLVSIRGTVLMLGMRELIFRFGERTMFCALTGESSRAPISNTAAIKGSAARRAFIRQFAPLWTMEPRAYAVSRKRRAIFLGCRLGKADNLFASQPAHQAGII